MTNTPNKTLDVQTLIAASLQHGQDSDPDHEAGDLQDYLRAGWPLVSADQRRAMLNHPRLKSALESAIGSDLSVTEEFLNDKAVERILDIFEAHGQDEGPEAEITDLQDALKTCWDILTQEQRTAFFELDSVQETFQNATTKPLFRYLVSTGWEHIFVGKRADTTRWVYDQHTESLVNAQVLNRSKWANLDEVAMADLLEDIHDNDATWDPEEWDLIKYSYVPSWQDVQDAQEAQESSESSRAVETLRG